MVNLITISKQTIGQATVQTVNARDLHAFLEIKSDFRHWIKNRINDFGFAENLDFVTTVKIYRGGKQKEYYLTLDMAKELSMVERNEKGKQARQYFIECERQVQSRPQNLAVDYSDPKLILGVVTHLQEESAKKDEVIADLKPKAVAYEQLTRADGTMCITNAAKILEIRPKDLFTYLAQHKWIYKRAGNASYIPYQSKIQSGLMDCPTKIISRPDGTDKVIENARVTAKGMAYLSQIFAGDFAAGRAIQ